MDWKRSLGWFKPGHSTRRDPRLAPLLGSGYIVSYFSRIRRISTFPDWDALRWNESQKLRSARVHLAARLVLQLLAFSR